MMTLGRRRTSRSISASAIPTAAKYHHAGHDHGSFGNNSTTATKAAAVPASTRGYRAEMGAPHERHLPRRTSHDNMGTLSRGRMGVSHLGHALPGLTSDLPRGTLQITTFKKEPK